MPSTVLKHRRIAGLSFTTALASLAFLSLGATSAPSDDFGPHPAPAAAQAFKVGSIKIMALHDAQFVVPNDAKVFGMDVGAGAVGALLKDKGLPDDRITLSVNVLLVRTANHVILIDTGLGPKANGALPESLTAAGVLPPQVTDVLITHTHGDHVGGLATADGQLAFPNAVIRMAAAEWEWMKTQPNAADVVKVIDGHVQTFIPGKSILPGITPVALDGHTPGHVGYEIASNGERLLDLGDLAHSSVISLQRPEWTMGFDGVAAVSKATRETTFTRLAKTHELVYAPHFPYPGVGHIVADGKVFAWEPQAL